MDLETLTSNYSEYTDCRQNRTWVGARYTSRVWDPICLTESGGTNRAGFIRGLSAACGNVYMYINHLVRSMINDKIHPVKIKVSMNERM